MNIISHKKFIFDDTSYHVWFKDDYYSVVSLKSNSKILNYHVSEIEN